MADPYTSCTFNPASSSKEGLPLIYGADISCSYGDRNPVMAVRDVSFAIEEAQITAIIGASGSGKSTLLKLIYGLEEPDKGEVRFRGVLVPTRKTKLIPGHEAMKLVSQDFDNLNLYAKVWDNIASQLSNTNIKRKEELTIKILKSLRVSHLAEQRVADLSGGEKQRVAIARALINEPQVLLMDEPFNQVDAAFRDELQRDIKKIVADTGLTVVLVSHDPAEVLAMADKLIIMKDGGIEASGIPEALYNEPSSIYTARLLAKSNPLSAEQADTIGIRTQKNILIHREWLHIRQSKEGRFSIKDILYRGFYKEICVASPAFELYIIVDLNFNLPLSTAVEIEVDRFLELNG